VCVRERARESERERESVYVCEVGGGVRGGERERPLLALLRCGIGTRRPGSLLRLRLLQLFARLAAWTSEFPSRSEVRPSVRRDQISQQKRPIMTLRSE
jgi:hypothetical protein